MNNNTKKRFSSKKFKYGTSAAVFTIVFVVFIILVNLLLSYIDGAGGGLYVDMTTEQLYGVSEASVKALKEVDKPVKIIFCSPRDKIVDEDILNPVVMLAENYEKTFDNVSVIYKDKLSDVKFFDSFIKTSDETISSYSIIVNCPYTGLSKIYNWDNMYKYNTEGIPFAFDGEYKLTSAILSTARSDDNMLSAGLVTGHGEDTENALQRFLEDFGYDVSLVDLKTITDEKLAEYDILLVYNPVIDFIGMEKNMIENSDASEEQVQTASAVQHESVNEIEKLRDYVTESFGNLFFFFEPSYANMPELFSLMEDGFGVRISNIYPVVDYGTLLSTGSYNADAYRFLGTYSTDAESAGYNVHKDLNKAGSPAFGISCLMDIPKKIVGNMEISPVVTTSEGAVVMAGNEVMEVPYVPLITLSKYTKLVDSKEKSGNVFISASSSFLSELDNPAFANADLFKAMLSKTGNSASILDIDFKVLDESNIEVTTADATAMRNKLGIIIPVIIAVIGIAVFIKRKYL
ncbi:MAG: Gldg family protein [Clostridia bacterium]|nr:Gldg family protein [Clostridia bacterium]